MLWVIISIRARYATLCDKVCQWLATGRWFFLDLPVFPTNRTDRRDITGILLNVALNTINQTNKQTNCCSTYHPSEILFPNTSHQRQTIHQYNYRQLKIKISFWSIISHIEEMWNHKTSWNPPHFIEVSVPSKESEVTAFYCLSIGVWNDSESMVFFIVFPSCSVVYLYGSKQKYQHCITSSSTHYPQHATFQKIKLRPNIDRFCFSLDNKYR